MIHTYIVYAPKSHHTNLGWTYNNFMKMIGDDDWACFLDHDVLFTTSKWYSQMEDILEKYPDHGLFTCPTNRIFKDFQRVLCVPWDNHDIAYHREVGKVLQDMYYKQIDELVNKTKLMSGVVILISKKTWKKVGGFKDGFLGVDNKIHLDCLENNIKVGLMKGIYVYHWYRGDGDMSHIIEANKLNKNPMKKLNND